MTAARTHVAWLLWCFDQGYIKAEDRAILRNWFLEDPATLHPDDAAARPDWLALADELLAAVTAEALTGTWTVSYTISSPVSGAVEILDIP